MPEQLSQVWALIRSVVIDPTSNLTVAVLLMAMLIIVVLIAAALIYLLLVLRTTGAPALEESSDSSESASAEELPPSESDAPEHESGTPRRRPDKRQLFVGLLVFGITLVATYALTGTAGFCADSCHAKSEAAESAAVDAHVSVSCGACHEAGGLLGVPANLAWRFECLGAQLTGYGVASRPVPAQRCLGCHEAILGEVLENEERGIRMEHAAPLAAGMSCEDCHDRAGHGTGLSAGMNPCLRCHDGQLASAECALCHTGDPTGAAVSERVFPKVVVANRDCGACHDLASCDACHGTRMPHSDTFVAYAHAREAAFDRKESCFVCHERSDCGACHASWDMGHGATPAERLADHRQKMDRAGLLGQAGCTCHNHNPYRNYCAICHEEAGPVF